MSEAIFATLQPGAVFHDRYRIVRCIKAGGMGAVYEIVDTRTDFGSEYVSRSSSPAIFDTLRLIVVNWGLLDPTYVASPNW